MGGGFSLAMPFFGTEKAVSAEARRGVGFSLACVFFFF